MTIASGSSAEGNQGVDRNATPMRWVESFKSYLIIILLPGATGLVLLDGHLNAVLLLGVGHFRCGITRCPLSLVVSPNVRRWMNRAWWSCIARCVRLSAWPKQERGAAGTNLRKPAKATRLGRQMEIPTPLQLAIRGQMGSRSLTQKSVETCEVNDKSTHSAMVTNAENTTQRSQVSWRPRKMLLRV